MRLQQYKNKKYYPIRPLILISGTIFSLVCALLLSCLDRNTYPLILLDTAVAVSLALSVFLLVYTILFVARALKRLSQAEEGPVQQAIVRLKTAISEVARGNLSIQTTDTDRDRTGIQTGDGLIRSEPLAPLLDAHQRIIRTIRESAQEFNQVTAPPCLRVVYVGADSFLEGKKCGRLLGRFLGGRGRVAVIMGNTLSAGQMLRKKGFQAVLLEEYPDITVVAQETDQESNEISPRITREILHAHPDLNGIYVTQGATPHIVARTVESAAGTGRIRIVTHDLTPATMECLDRGLIAGTLSQNPFAQGFDAVIELYNYLVTGENPPLTRQLTALQEITADNMSEHWDRNRGERLSDATRTGLARAVPNPSRRRVKIGVILPDETGFWEPVAAGARRAEETLLALNAIVTPVLNEAIRRRDWSAAAFIPVIRQLIDDGCQGVCLPIFDPALVPFINQQSADGVYFASFNAEPISLRGMIDSISSHAGHLFEMSEGLAAHAAENTQAVNQITGTMKLLLVGTLNQIQHLSRTDELIQALIGLIGRVRDETTAGLSTAAATRQTAMAGHQIVRHTQDVMKALDHNARVTDEVIRALNGAVMKIGEITGFIDDLTGQTNLLAINASIQASQAGERGRGFSVVAQEIRTLAEQAARATADINELIGAILAGVQRATASVHAASEQVTRSVTITDRTESVFREIAEASTENETKIEGILSRTAGMLGVSEEVQTAMAELTRLNRENGTAVEKTTTAVMEMNKRIGEIGRAAQLLKEMGRSQEDLLSQFTLE